MERPSFTLDGFEGPLDLLLHLISKHKLNILDIPISQLLDQYLEYLEGARAQDLDIASEFLEMAARLVYLKTLSLLPRREEEEQLKTELTGQLLEYQALKVVAALLAAQNRGHTIFVRGPQLVEVDKTYQCRHLPKELARAYVSATGRGKRRLPPPVESFQPLVSRPVVSVESRMEYLTAALSRPQRISQLFLKSRNRSELVATFLALLEMVKDKRVEVSGETAVLCGGNSNVS
ncbi:segregation and condensation protein A [Merdimmobilis hominis]|uniref:segregation and condensation protein A n=1 Tax=Merdimmobilis hominis TaxID=2897707 RepID=UPI0008F8C8B3|nr:segregation/condensation protein A [Merdimmobilis hominis]